MNFWQAIKRPPWRTVIPGGILLLAVWMAYHFWQPGLDVCDGRDDHGQNGIWLSHAWLGDDKWFRQNHKTNEISEYRDPAKIQSLAEKLRANHITDIFPHLCPAEPNGKLPAVDAVQLERFLDAFPDSRIIPWIGGPNGGSVRLNNATWRAAFVTNVQQLIAAHPRLAGVQLNIEPLPSGNADFLDLLEKLRAALPAGKMLSVAAYPPPTRWQPFSDVHWDENYYREVCQRSDQIAVMMYDVGLRKPKAYQYLMAGWTREVLQWSDGKPVLLGVPTYSDAGVDYHDPKVENITDALLGIHRGLSQMGSVTNYQGVAIYCDWETTSADWEYFQGHFVNTNMLVK